MLSRSYARHAAHMALAVFQLYGRRKSYHDLKNCIGEAKDEFIPDWEMVQESGHAHVCMLGCCPALARRLLMLKPSDANDEIASPSSPGTAATTRAFGGQAESCSPGSGHDSISIVDPIGRDVGGEDGAVCMDSQQRRQPLTKQQQQQLMLAEQVLPSPTKVPSGHDFSAASQGQRAVSFSGKIPPPPISSLGLSEDTLMGNQLSPTSSIGLDLTPSVLPQGGGRAFSVQRSAAKPFQGTESSLTSGVIDDCDDSARSGESGIVRFSPGPVPKLPVNGRRGDINGGGSSMRVAGYRSQPIQSTIVSDCATNGSGRVASEEGRQRQRQRQRQGQQQQQLLRQQQQGETWNDRSSSQQKKSRSCACDASGRTASLGALPRVMDWACADCSSSSGFPWQSTNSNGSVESALHTSITSTPLLPSAREQTQAWSGRSELEEDSGGSGERHQNGIPLPGLNHVNDQHADNGSLELHQHQQQHQQRQSDSGFISQQQSSNGQWQGSSSSSGVSYWPGGGSDSKGATGRTNNESSIRPESEFDFSELGYLLCEDGLPSSPVSHLNGDLNSPDAARIG